MKPAIIFFTLCLLMCNTFGQSACADVKVQTPVVSKLSGIEITPSASCNEITLHWKGNAHQNYLASYYYSDTSQQPIVQTASAICDNFFNCTVTLPVKPDCKINWGIQASQIIDERKFYGYPLRGEFSGCKEADIVDMVMRTLPAKSASSTPLIFGLTIYPNPTTGELTLKWIDEYKGAAKLTIMDASGKLVKSMFFTKLQLNYSDKLNVAAFSSGLYYLYINMQNGKSVSTKFVKK